MRKLNSRYKVTATLILLLVGVTTSCLKDEGRVDFSDVGYVIEMLDAKAIGRSISLNSTGQDMMLDVRVNQTGADATDHDITVTVGLNPDAVATYNQDHSHVPGVMVDPSWVDFPASVTIKAGLDDFGNKNRVAVIPLTIHSGSLPKGSGNYVVPLQIVSASPTTTISGNFGAILFNFYHNIYDGVYTMGGQMDRYSATTGAPLGDALSGPMKAGVTTNVITVGENTSTFVMHWSDGSNVGGVGDTATPQITVKPDNSLVLDITDGGTTPANWGPIASKTNYYDPAARKFYINYKWAADAPSPTATTRGMEYVLT
ncbi:MAG TPA: DUF1735 domain-containing protein, partial [Cyclobacteriaceae bacterium]|nr:DUF1735 domain-containing protein [Cyclobacteriaceae bacterium]